MCGLAGEIRFDGRTADVAACERMNDCQEARGPDGSGIWARGPVALGHRRLSIIDLSVGRFAADGGLAARSERRLQRLHLQLPAAARRARGSRVPVLLDLGHRGDRQGVRALGAVVRRALPRDVRLRDLRARQRTARPGPGPAGDQAAVPRPHPGTSAVRLQPAGAARRRRRGHLGRHDRPVVLHDVPLGRARAADDPGRGHQAAAGDRTGDRARREHRHRLALLGAGLRPGPRPGRLDRTGLGGRAAVLAAHRGRPPDGGRRPGRGAAVRRHRLESGGGAAGRGRAARPEDLQHRVRVRRRRVRRRVRVLDAGGRAVRARTTTGSRSPPTGCFPASTRRSGR